MLDETDRLRTNPRLLELLSYYGHLGEVDREIWQNRLMALGEVDAKELVKLHGELIAFSWVEQNTGQVPCCYRITLAGLRAMKQVQGVEVGEEVAEVTEKPAPRFQRKKKEKFDEATALATAVP